MVQPAQDKLSDDERAQDFLGGAERLASQRFEAAGDHLLAVERLRTLGIFSQEFVQATSRLLDDEPIDGDIGMEFARLLTAADEIVWKSKELDGFLRAAAEILAQGSYLQDSEAKVVLRTEGASLKRNLTRILRALQATFPRRRNLGVALSILEERALCLGFIQTLDTFRIHPSDPALAPMLYGLIGDIAQQRAAAMFISKALRP